MNLFDAPYNRWLHGGGVILCKEEVYNCSTGCMPFKPLGEMPVDEQGST